MITLKEVRENQEVEALIQGAQKQLNLRQEPQRLHKQYCFPEEMSNKQ